MSIMKNYIILTILDKKINKKKRLEQKDRKSLEKVDPEKALYSLPVKSGKLTSGIGKTGKSDSDRTGLEHSYIRQNNMYHNVFKYMAAFFSIYTYIQIYSWDILYNNSRPMFFIWEPFYSFIIFKNLHSNVEK